MAVGDLTKAFMREGGTAYTSGSNSKLTKIVRSCAYFAVFSIVPLNPIEPRMGFVSDAEFTQHIARINDYHAQKLAEAEREKLLSQTAQAPNGNSTRWAPTPASYTANLVDRLSSRIAGSLNNDQIVRAQLKEKHVDPIGHTYSFGDYKVTGEVMLAIVQGSLKTNMEPKIMMAVAEKESAFKPHVKARTSSATGLFQFINSTWLETVKLHGSKHGLSNEADAIKVTYSKKKKRTIYKVRNSSMRTHIMNLRKNPYIATLMAGEYIQSARAKLEARTGKAVAQEDVYLPHFLGTNGAGRLLEASASRPDRAAKSVFPRAARANRSIFRSKRRWITIAQLHNRLRGIIQKRMDKYENVVALAGLDKKADPLGPGPAIKNTQEAPVVLAGLKM